MRETETSAGAQDGRRKLDDSVLAEGLALSPDATLVAGSAAIGRRSAGKASTAGTVLWSTADGTVVRRFDDGLSGALAWRPDGSLLAVGGPRHVELVAPDGQVRWTLSGFGEPQEGQGRRRILSIAFSPDGSMVVAAGADGSVRMWMLEADRCDVGPVIDARGVMPQSVAVSMDGRTVAVAGPGGPVELRDIGSGERNGAVEGTEHAPGAVAYASDGTLLVGTGGTTRGSTDASARLYAVAPGARPQEGPVPRGRDVAGISISPDGSRVACVGLGGNEIMLWSRADDGREDLPRTPGPVGGLALAADGSRLYAAVRTTGMMTWDGTTWTAFDAP